MKESIRKTFSALPSKRLFVLSVKMVLALLLVTLTAFPIPPGAAVAPPQLNQITSCVEVPSSVVDASRKRASTRSDCSPTVARNRAREQSKVNARDAIASVCRDEISQAEAVALCRAASGSVPTAGTALSADPHPGAGGSAVDSELPISQSSPKLCATLRDVPEETVTSTSQAGPANGFCVFNDGRVTTATIRTRARCGVQCFDVHQHELRVRRFTTSVLTPTDADRILLDATTVLKTDEGAGDVPCNVTVSRIGAVTEFDDGDGSVDSNAEFDNLMDLTGNVMVVNDINFCGQSIPNVIGCAPVPGNSLAVVRITPDQEGMLWAHEFGHNKGLPHRSNDVNAVMFPSIADIRRRITSGECSAYRTLAGIPSAPEMFHLADGRPRDARMMVARFNGTTSSWDAQIDVSQFVRQTFIHGVPYKEAIKYSSDVPRLLEMLNNRAEEKHWPNIVVVLGMIGDEQSLNPMIAFLERDRGRISPPHYRAKTALVMSLGYMIHKTGSRKALDYLTSGLAPEIWSTRLGANLAPYQRSMTERNYDFAKFAVLGLSLSGRPEAASALRSLQAPTTDRVQQTFRERIKDLIPEALKEHQEIARKGLAEYYRSQE